MVFADLPVLLYYLKCDVSLAPNPFREPLFEASSKVRECNSSLHSVVDAASKLIAQAEVSVRGRA